MTSFITYFLDPTLLARGPYERLSTHLLVSDTIDCLSALSIEATTLPVNLTREIASSMRLYY